MKTLFTTKSRTIPITEEMVMSAYLKVKSNKGSAGIDNESLKKFEENLSKNLYKLWNRLASGSYFPPSVKAVEIPKNQGGVRILGIPTVGDRICQEVIKSYLEPRLEKEFHKNSYGYRPLKGAYQAVKQVQENVHKYEWVLDMDIKSFFDEIDHELLMKAIDIHVEERWVKMYIRRWLTAEMEGKTGVIERKSGIGTPQGGVISPLLSNLYLHYALDKWLTKHYPGTSFVRYADDMVVHCSSEEESLLVLEAIRKRLREAKLRLNEVKTKIVHCKDYRRKKETSYAKKFGFLGFEFKPKMLPSIKEEGDCFLGYVCEMSDQARKRTSDKWKTEGWHKKTDQNIVQLSEKINIQRRGVLQYYGRISMKGVMLRLLRQLNCRLVKWAKNKYKSLKGSYTKAYKWLKKIKRDYPNLFYHWTVYRWI